MYRYLCALTIAAFLAMSASATSIYDDPSAAANSDSGQYGSYAAGQAIDDDSENQWNAGEIFREWIETNLDQVHDAVSIDFTTQYPPAENDTHEIWLSSFTMQKNFTDAVLARAYQWLHK